MKAKKRCLLSFDFSLYILLKNIIPIKKKISSITLLKGLMLYSMYKKFEKRNIIAVLIYFSPKNTLPN
jgi:hypothetical protein